jgi:long-chain acyl-CoA synthetase
VGQPIAGVEIRIAPDGEILARGPNVAVRGYHRREIETRETFADGWLRTGDIGHLDEDRFLYITDRKKEFIVTSGGSNIAPQPIEEALKRDRLIAHAVICGDRRPYPVALIAVNGQEIVQFARDRGLLLIDYAALARHPAVVERVAETVKTVNRGLPSYARIRRFALTPREFSEEGGELTPTQKVRRRVVAEKYRDLLESLYHTEPGRRRGKDFDDAGGQKAS